MVNVTLHFVRRKDHDPGDRMVEAFESLKEMVEETDCQWIEEEKCKHIKEKLKGHIFVFEEFGCQVFNHIVATGNKCYGPVCILACLKNGEAIPQVHPTFCLAMKSCTISCTGVPKDTREEVSKKISWMYGEVSKDFHDSVTHLIVGEVGSKKYKVAANLKRRLMSIKWIDSLLEMSKHKLVHANDPEFLQKYRCPIFLGLVVTVSGLESKERNQIKDMIESEGGKYTGEMKINECTHLIVKSARGQKYQFAVKWQLHIITPKWIIKSLEAGYCLDVNDFKVDTDATQPEQTATSTPNREKGAARYSSISDVSAISVSHVDESAMFNHTVNSVSIAQQSTMRIQGDILDSVDLQKFSGDFFLDGCNIFLSGFTASQMEKLKKMLNLAGAMRINDITPNVSHVVIGKTIEEHIQQIEQLPTRPFVITVEWLVESMKAVKCLPEHMFMYMDLNQKETVVEKVKKDKKNSVSKLMKEEASFLAPPNSQRMEANDMDDIMSQYMPQNAGGASMSTMGDSTLMQMEAAADIPAGTSASAKKTETPSKPAENLEDMETQDPNDVTEIQGDEEHPFRGKTFIILGFDQDQTAELESFIIENGGVIAPQTTRRIPDYAIVPIMGFPVERTVNEVVTNAWLQMSVEEGEILPVDGNEIFTPINPKDESSRPLEGLVLSISGYAGTERDVLSHIAQILGAVSQEFFVRKPKDSYLANTHLIVNAAEGSKYNAAKKWKIPAVDKSWLISCAKEGKRLPEDDYIVGQVKAVMPKEAAAKSPASRTEQVKAVEKDTTRTASQEKMPPPPGVPIAIAKQHLATKRHSNETISEDHGKSRRLTRQSSSSSTSDLPPPANSPATTRTSTEITNRTSESTGNKISVKQPKNQTGKDTDEDKTLSEDELQSNNTTVDMNDSDVGTLRNHVMMDTDVSLIDENTTSHKENTPVRSHLQKDDNHKVLLEQNHKSRKDEGLSKSLVNPKVQKLINENRKITPKSPATNQDNTEESDGWETPSKFCTEGVIYEPNFSLTEVYACLENMDTPGRTPKANRRQSSISLEEQLSKHLDVAIKNSSVQPDVMIPPPESPAVFRVDTPLPLSGVVIVVAKKLLAKQSDYNNIASNLGADYRWKYDSSVTHYIFQGRQNDMNKEFRQARDNKKKIVSPHWLIACQEENRHIDESLYPHTYNPNLSLSITTTKTPVRATRSTRSSRTTVNETSTPLAAVPPKRSTRNRFNKSENTLTSIESTSVNDNTSSDENASSTSTKPTKNKIDKSKVGIINKETVGSKKAGKTYSSASTNESEDGANTSKENMEVDDNEDNIKRNMNFEDVTITPSKKTISSDTTEGEADHSKSDSLMNDLKTLMAATGGGPPKSYGKQRPKKWRASETSFDRICEGENETSVGTPQSSRRGSTVRNAPKDEESDDLKRTRSSSALANPTPVVETLQSQMIEVCWDDPKAREQQEKLALDLAKQSQSLSPHSENPPVISTAQIGQQLKRRDSYSKVGVESSDSEVELNIPKSKKDKGRKGQLLEERTPTPDAPSLAFPLPKTSTSVSPPKPLDVSAHSEEEESEEVEEETPVFLMSGIDQRERVDYSALISSLGGEVSDAANFDMNATHLVVSQPSRNEKYLAAMATGKWILHKSYFEACRSENKFVQEQEYEWGSESTERLCKGDSMLKLAYAAHRWRLKIEELKKTNPSCKGAFNGWRVLLCTNKASSFKRLLEAGGAEVVSTSLPYNNLKGISHLFIDSKLVGQVDLESLIEANIHCCKLEYMSGYLTDYPSPLPNQYYVDGVEQFLQRDEQAKKRKSSTTDFSSTPSKRKKLNS